MNLTSQEQVLCARTADLPPSWLPECGFVPLDESEFTSALDPIQPHWLARADAESDPTYKQWIPYVLLRNAQGHLATYARQGGETRLHGCWSLGLGGHINPVDASESWRSRSNAGQLGGVDLQVCRLQGALPPRGGVGDSGNRQVGDLPHGPQDANGWSWRDCLWAGFQRELAEEFPGATPGHTRFLGLVHENRSVVGRVHLGAVFVHDAASIEGKPGAELASLRWLSPQDIGSSNCPLERFELWSQQSLKLLQASPWA